MSRILITGASGFIGRELTAQLLAAGHDVTCLMRSSGRVPEEIGGQVQVAVGDVREPQTLRSAVAGQDYVFHLAGLVKAFRAQELYDVNAEGTRALAEVCAAQPNPPALVFVSSLAAVGPSKWGKPRVESDRPAPVSEYGHSKLAAEEKLRQFAARMPTTIVRPGVVFGPGDTNSFAMFRPISRFGIHAMPGREPTAISAIHNADLGRFLWLAAERGERLSEDASDFSTGVYFAATPDNIGYEEFGRLIAAAMGRENLRILRNPAWQGYLVAGLWEIFGRLRRRPMIFNLDKAREAFAGSWQCSVAKAQRDLDFRPAASLAERLAETVEWYRAEGWLRRPTREATSRRAVRTSMRDRSVAS